jgi:hypothetical protein
MSDPYKATGLVFDGKTAATGLFDPSQFTGSPSIQVRVNSVLFSTDGALSAWELYIEDPADGTQTLLLTGTGANMAASGPSGFMIMPTNSDQRPWRLAFVASGLDSPGTLTVDFDFEGTPG